MKKAKKQVEQMKEDENKVLIKTNIRGRGLSVRFN